MISCPNCGYRQPDGPKCVKCSSLFSYYSEASPPQSDTAGDDSLGSIHEAAPRNILSRESRSEAELIDPAAGARFEQLRKAYRVFRWVSVTVLAAVILLILHKAPPPQVPTSPQAAARAESKIAAAQAAVQQGQPYQLSLDRSELNSYLSSNLAVPGSSANSADAANPAQSASTSSSPDSPSSDASAASSDLGAAAAALDSNSNASIEQVQSAVKDVKVDMDGDLVKAYVVFDFHGKDLSLELDGHLSAEDGYLHFDPTGGQLGSLPLPQSTLDAAVQKLMSSPENREKMKLPDGVKNIQIVNGHVVVSYQ